MLLHFALFIVWLSNERLTNKSGKQHCGLSLKIQRVNDMNINLIGGGCNFFTYDELKSNAWNSDHVPSVKYKFHSYISHSDALALSSCKNSFLIVDCPLNLLVSRLTVADLKVVAAAHNLFVHSKNKHATIKLAILDHDCQNCSVYASVFESIQTLDKNTFLAQKRLSNLITVQKYQKKHLEKYKHSHLAAVRKNQVKNQEKYKKMHLASVQKYNMKQEFPPCPPSLKLQQTIVHDFCNDMLPNKFMESGCCVCGKLTSITHLKDVANLNLDFQLLKAVGVTQKERFCVDDPIVDLEGPVFVRNLKKICNKCCSIMSKGKIPADALANGLWIGDVPDALRNLTYAEQMLIAKVRHNRCIVRVSSGMHKMRANAIVFANPMPKIYNILPPPVDELDDVLAFIYTGPCKPTKSDFERTPLLVRRNKVATALNWLKLNHADYYDIEISQKNLGDYPESDIPVFVDYYQSFSNKNSESTAVHDNEEEDGTESGQCPFVVHGLTGDEYSSKSIKAIKAIALKHLTSGGKVLAIGHAKEPESIYNNPQLFPQMMPWLFPYGLGGIGNSKMHGKLSDLKHKKHLLMYHDKRFQTDPHFPLIAFNHEQIKDCSSGAYLLAERSNFDAISQRLLNVNANVLQQISSKLENGEHIVPETDEEKLCFQLIKDLDHVGGHVKGSLTNKKYMRNEIWSLISFVGAPSWFITFSPADTKHPISLYYADMAETFNPKLRNYDERYRLIANNPVAGARFFHFMCEMFIKHILGVGTNHPGFYGKTNAYYGVIEQQGRLTLHMHMLLWILGCMSPQEIRDKIMDPNSDFQKKIVEYLECVHVGEFLTGDLDHVKAEVEENVKDNFYQDPTQTLPDAPPHSCKCALESVDDCSSCKSMTLWWNRFSKIVDDLVFRSNVHNCGKYGSDNEKVKKKERPTCTNKHGKCKARFPRNVYLETQVDPLTGALNMKKGEPWINTFSPLVTYLLRCNTDITSLLSGTAIKAVVAYVSEYITKPGLKTYVMFDTIRSVFERNTEMLTSSLRQKDKARRLITQIVNSLTAKLEIGSPMASSYLLGLPDHYKSHKFNHVYWRIYVTEVLKAWCTDDNKMDVDNDKVVLQRKNGRIIGVSKIQDYIYRPAEYENITLYEWLQCAKRIVKTSKSVVQLMVFESDNESISEKESIISDSGDELNLKDHDFDNSNINGSAHNNVTGLFSNDNMDNNDHQILFLQDHPLFETHCVEFDIKKNKNFVPNFFGGSLPRRDRGDREYYCTTMLTLFKPWRNGKDLKQNDESWDDAFTQYKFNPRQSEIMNNFNIRYECFDARDDFSAQLKKESVLSGGFVSGFMNSEIISDLDDDHHDEDAFFDNQDDQAQCDNNDDFVRLKYSIPGKYGKAIQVQMETTEHVVRSAGWLDECPDGHEYVCKTPIEPESSYSGTKWKSIVQDQRQQLLAKRIQNIPSVLSNTVFQHVDPNENNIMVVDQSYFMYNFKALNTKRQNLIDSTVVKYSLNAEQERAFRIVANHSSSTNDQLKMYLGGMAGTGKSQVIKAITKFFTVVNECHRFVILGPTGTAAALQNGSTYHYFLGINPKSQTLGEATTIAQVKARMEGVDYIFIDEVSMLSCHDLYNISAKLAKMMNVHDQPFGGINMIFAGDFAQLPPVGGAPLYSGTVGTSVNAALTCYSQESAIGKALWHQITTVVILRENMRQKTQSAEDALLRTALVNMRYGKCTPDDIKFLRSRIAGKQPGQPNVASKNFRNVPIICGIHSQKDQINLLGCERFASDTKQNLTNFYSIDKWGKDIDSSVKKRQRMSSSKSLYVKSDIDFADQKEIWKVRHGATENFAGKLSLCLGMPVMIRNNDATELSITKGQEGFVVGWKSIQGTHGKTALETLFVQLDNPTKLVQIPGLPDNVVPIVKSTKTIQCQFPSDLKETIERQQACVLPNFAMTAHAAQGKTRPYNVVHLNSCLSHMSYYSSLSRSATAAGTVIIQGFDPKVITRGCSGYLRQEFRELEILDDITKIRYEGDLPDYIDGLFRHDLCHKYVSWKGVHHVPAETDSALRWSANDPLHLSSTTDTASWKLVDKKLYQKKKKTSSSSLFIPAKGSLSLSLKKRQLLNPLISFPKHAKIVQLSTHTSPAGLIWDSQNYSCAYDSLLVILYDIWQSNHMKWSGVFRNMNDHLNVLCDGFAEFSNENSSFEQVRNYWRFILHNKNPTAFPRGFNGISVDMLASEMLNVTNAVSFSQERCTSCDYAKNPIDDRLGYVLHADSSVTADSTITWVNSLCHHTRSTCPICQTALKQHVFYKEVPHILALEYPMKNIVTSHWLHFETDDGVKALTLRGVVYYGAYHFTSRIVSASGHVWYHDGMSTGNICNDDGLLNLMSDTDIKTCRSRDLVLAIYAQEL